MESGEGRIVGTGAALLAALRRPARRPRRFLVGFKVCAPLLMGGVCRFCDGGALLLPGAARSFAGKTAVAHAALFLKKRRAFARRAEPRPTG